MFSNRRSTDDFAEEIARAREHVLPGRGAAATNERSRAGAAAVAAPRVLRGVGRCARGPGARRSPKQGSVG